MDRQYVMLLQQTELFVTKFIHDEQFQAGWLAGVGCGVGVGVGVGNVPRSLMRFEI